MRCPHCPIPAGRRCKGESHRRLCDLRDRDHPDFKEGYLRPIAGEDGAVEATATQALPTAASSPEIAAALSVAKAIGRCKHRKRGPHCGCSGMMRCERDELDVTWGDCVACKTAEAAEDAPSPS